MTELKISLVHDWLTSYAGAERVLEAMLELYPDSPIFTLVYDSEGIGFGPIASAQIQSSFIQRLPWGKKKYRSYLPLMPLAVEQFNLEAAEVVISSSHAVAKGVLTRADQLHISYVHTPIRYAWDLQNQYLREAGLERGLKGALARWLLHYIRNWDVASANRVDVFVANSRYVARRIWKTYRRKARVIYPPVDVERFTPRPDREDFYLTLSRLVPYKKMDLIVSAFTRIGRPLVVIGDGPDFAKIKRLAGTNVKLLGHQPDEVVRDHMERCKAFVFAADEDFGIAPVEAQAAGAPVIAFGKGGVTETVIPDKTGLFFETQEEKSLAEAVISFEQGDWRFDVQAIRENAERFSKQRFLAEFSELVEGSWSRFKAGDLGW